MKPLLLSVLFAVASFAGGDVQVGPLHVIHYQANNYFATFPNQIEDADWYVVMVRTETPGISAFRVTIRYRESGEIKSATVATPLHDGQRYAWAQIGGRYDVVGIVIEELRAEPAIEIKP